MPTADALTHKMLQLARVTSKDRLYDLGAGDGRIAIAAAKDFGAESVGIEYDASLVRLAQCLADAEGVAQKVDIVQGDIFKSDFSDATVVTLYLLPELNLKLRPTLLELTPGTRIVSHSWLMDEWEPDDQTSAGNAHAYLWIVPAKIEGTWTFVRDDGQERFTVQFEQSFQHVKGRVASGDGSRPLWQSKLRADELTFSFADASTITRVIGTVAGKRIDARVSRNDVTASFVGKRL
ncbi:MAG TPA: class I SAM-dependent methyltransferase [Steroidobacteraceae bacterium]|nr:class I SAM-dependent methyltransferase [Steroidobacteraceae bacterium]